MPALVIAEHDNATLDAATAKSVSAALMVCAPVHVLVAGKDCAAVAAEAASLAGVEKILLADHTHYAHALAEPMAALILSCASAYDAILAPTTANGKNILPRVAAALDLPQLSDIVAIESPDIFLRTIYAGNALQRVQAAGMKKIITVRAAAFKAAARGGAANVETIPAAGDPGRSRFISESLTRSERPDLANARIVVSGGRGLGSKENFALVGRIADRLGAAVGASRAAVDAGFVPNDCQVGQTGKIVAPELYIAIGISGAIQHLAGMKDSKIVAAINKDENAPIFAIADYGLVADLFQALPEFERALGETVMAA